MTNKQFRHDLRRGLGSCQAAFSDCKDIYIFHDDLLWGCRYALAYDAQSEGTRATYLFEMIKKYDEWSDFLKTASEGAVRAIKDDGWRFAHFCDLIALMSSSGYKPAQKIMNVLYERLFNAVRTGRTPRIRMSIPAVDNFSYICINMITDTSLSKADSELVFLRIVRDYGKLIKYRSAWNNLFKDDEFEMAAADILGEKKTEYLLDENSDDPDIKRYISNSRRLDKMRKKYRLQVKQEEKPVTAQLIYEILSSDDCQNGMELSGKLAKLIRNDQMDEIKKLVDMYSSGKNDKIRQHLLELLDKKRVLPLFDKPAVDRLFEDVKSDNIKLSERAGLLLVYVRDDRLHDLATKKLVSDPRATVALEMLINNYRSGDSETIINCVISSGSFGNNLDKSHRIFDAIYDVISSDPDACRELSATLLPYMFKETPCSHCRYLFAKKMQELKLLTPQLIKMCQYDCNEDIRKLVF